MRGSEVRAEKIHSRRTSHINSDPSRWSVNNSLPSFCNKLNKVLDAIATASYRVITRVFICAFKRQNAKIFALSFSIVALQRYRR